MVVTKAQERSVVFCPSCENVIDKCNSNCGEYFKDGDSIVCDEQCRHYHEECYE